ncbi:MAG: C69 family dipeptidase [Leptospiraceae bacterium]|nr:C69 family dipeptidase [Leptospiraceae bacterium]
MCDTFVATSEFSGNNLVFGKNSDREPNEAQAIVRIPRTLWDEKHLQTTFITIPQVKETNEVILSKPFFMWGAEMGANEYGVTIGNEAVFTKVKLAKKNDGLTGMDMLRLALERANTAKRAFEIITELLEEYGQDACGGYKDRNFFYHNSFLIADPNEAYLLETVGKQWAGLKVKGFRSISNGLTIESEYEYSSKDLVDFAHKQGFLSKGEDFNFRKAYSDSFFTFFSKCKMRRSLSSQKGEEAKPKMDAKAAFGILRTHNTDNLDFKPSQSDMSSLCLHATGITTPSQTTGSMVAELRKNKPSTFWFTGTAAPCLSLFKPFFIPGNNIKQGEFLTPGEKPDDSLWWKHERLHRHALNNYAEISKVFLSQRNELEEEFLQEEQKLLEKPDINKLNEFSELSLQKSVSILEKWLQEAESKPIKRTFAPLYNLYWKLQNKQVGYEMKKG